MKSDKLYLFKDKRFLPNFIVQFCGCLNDNILKNALIILITYGLTNQLGEYSSMLVLVANTIFVLPFIIFASIAGQVADPFLSVTVMVFIVEHLSVGIQDKISLGLNAEIKFTLPIINPKTTSKKYNFFICFCF